MLQNKQIDWFSVINISLLTIIGLISIFPIYYVFAVSFTDPSEYIRNGLVLFPQKWTLRSYQYLLSTNAFIQATGNSIFLATVGTALSLLVTSSLSYALSRKRFAGRKFFLLIILFTTLFNPGIIPAYLLVRELGLINSIWSLIIPALTSGWYVLLMKGFFDSIPADLEDASRIDGCNDTGLFFRIVLPLSMPALAAFGLFYAVGYWNTFFNAILYINDFHKQPLQVLLRNMLIESSTAVSGEAAAAINSEQRIPPETLKMAAVIIATLPIMMVYPFLQKHFAKGAMIGSVKA
ncbi:carbohydrate ABC transporter permease [Paenibacillus sp. N3.4]|uniref:carbohydrate ABC transporter permease n=1 Tax=Paenibacillus sp. N3.4 TaxID=2603222 RepID=UPI0011CA67DE|nr:carbohydrate ABC transporter permease [Paenibacillus sp. N3.4]TXK75872.1 carbohydrate ABC transporter permease [Paenibacillus sp. N3.4]